MPPAVVRSFEPSSGHRSGVGKPDDRRDGARVDATRDPFFRLVWSERAVWANGPRSQHTEGDDVLADYVA